MAVCASQPTSPPCAAGCRDVAVHRRGDGYTTVGSRHGGAAVEYRVHSLWHGVGEGHVSSGVPEDVDHRGLCAGLGQSVGS